MNYITTYGRVNISSEEYQEYRSLKQLTKNMSNIINAKTHPISFKKLTDYLLSQVGSSPELTEHAQLIAAASAQMALNSSGGILYDFLSQQGIDVGIYKVWQNNEWDWFYSIYQGDKEDSKICSKGRKEAEKAGIAAAMDILEKQ